MLAEAAEKWPSGWGPRAGAASLQARATFPRPLPLNPRVRLALGKMRHFWPSLEELATEKENGSGSGGQVFRFQRETVESRRKSMICGYDLMCV